MWSVYVGDLQTDVDEHDLLQVFNRTGNITSIHVCRDVDTDNSLGYAYVNYSKKESAELALEMLNYHKIQGKSCRVMWSQHVEESKKMGDANLFVKNLEKQIESKDLHEIFSKFGNILSCKVATNEQEESLGYGYVDFEREEDAERAIKKCNRMRISGKEIQVGYFVEKNIRIQRRTMKFPPKNKVTAQSSSSFKGQVLTNLYIKRLGKHITESMLRQKFEQFGNITSVKIERDESNTSKGFGFVNFLNQQDAANAIKGMNEAIFEGKWIYVGYAQKKGERNEFLSKQFNSTNNIPNRLGPGKFTPNLRHDQVNRRQIMGNTVKTQNYIPEKRHSYSSECLNGYNLPRKTRSSTINRNLIHTQVLESGDYSPKLRNETETFSYYTRQNTDTRIRPMSYSQSNERLWDHKAPLKATSEISLTNKTDSSQIFTEERFKKYKHLVPLAKKLVETKLNCPQQTSTAKNLYSGSKYQQECVENEDDVFMSVGTVSDKIYDVAKKEYPNEANLIVKIVTEKCNGKQQQLIGNSKSLLENEVEKAHLKIRMLETPQCLNYS
ncbi:hypothetical protein LOD99_14953 [Oopsacas minuta]|uniref:RRM domain-containing protein n=1 Tax=Oopsacas minuta TaxID=111878 RepID=A0AAV7KDC9_9METZ|nr:hypothetical protein LOD99_14953 [Oopsacas minuta]